MKPFKDWLISKKLLFIILFISSVTLAGALSIVIYNDIRLFERHQQRKLVTLAQVIANNAQASIAFDDPTDAAGHLSALKAEEHIIAAAIYKKDGHLFAMYTTRSPYKTLLKQ